MCFAERYRPGKYRTENSSETVARTRTLVSIKSLHVTCKLCWSLLSFSNQRELENKNTRSINIHHGCFIRVCYWQVRYLSISEPETREYIECIFRCLAQVSASTGKSWWLWRRVRHELPPRGFVIGSCDEMLRDSR